MKLTLSNNDSDGYENVTQKVNSHYFKIYRAYSNSFSLSNIGKFSGVEFSKSVSKFRKKKKSLPFVHVLDKT